MFKLNSNALRMVFLVSSIVVISNGYATTADYEGAFTIGEKIHRVFIHNDVIKLPNRPLETLDLLYWD